MKRGEERKQIVLSLEGEVQYSFFVRIFAADMREHGFKKGKK